MVNRDLLTKVVNSIPETHRPLAEALQGSARYTISNPMLSLKKSNIALRMIVRDLYAKEMQKDGTVSELRTLLNNKHFIEKIKPRRMYLLMNLILKMTEAQANDLIDTKAAKIVLDYLMDLTSWYTKQLLTKEKLSVPFEIESLTPTSFGKLDLPAYDYEAAAKWFLIAAEKGNTIAQYNLGVLYNHGKGVPRNLKEAAKWYSLAAEKKDSNALYALGILYQLGQGIEQDEKNPLNYMN